jgi:hypothetical protein
LRQFRTYVMTIAMDPVKLALVEASASRGTEVVHNRGPRGRKFFTPNGRNPLKSPDSKK